MLKKIDQILKKMSANTYKYPSHNINKFVLFYFIKFSLFYQQVYFVQINTLLLADVFENFQNMCFEIYELDPTRFLSAPALAREVALKKTKVKLDLLTDINLLLMVKKGNRGGIC